MKNVLIVGAPRTGKTTLARRLNKELNMSIYSLDQILSMFVGAYPQLGFVFDNDDDGAAKKLTPFLISCVDVLSKGVIFKRGGNFVIEGTYMDFDNVVPYIDQSKTMIICLTHGSLSAKKLYNNLKKYDTEDDWTNIDDDNRLKKHINYFVERNKYFKEQAKKHKLITVDTSDDRREPFKELIEMIKNS